MSHCRKKIIFSKQLWSSLPLIPKQISEMHQLKIIMNYLQKNCSNVTHVTWNCPALKGLQYSSTAIPVHIQKLIRLEGNF